MARLFCNRMARHPGQAIGWFKDSPEALDFYVQSQGGRLLSPEEGGDVDPMYAMGVQSESQNHFTFSLGYESVTAEIGKAGWMSRDLSIPDELEVSQTAIKAQLAFGSSIPPMQATDKTTVLANSRVEEWVTSPACLRQAEKEVLQREKDGIYFKWVGPSVDTGM